MKHKYEATGLDRQGREFRGGCISVDIVDAIEIFRREGFSVHSISQKEQVRKDSDIGIVRVCYKMFGVWY